MSTQEQTSLKDTGTPPEIQPHYALIAGKASLVTVAVLVLIKSFAYWQSGAASVLASLIDSVIDTGASLLSFFAIHISLKPADREHRHGHGKVEGLAALFQAAFITGAGALLLLESVRRFLYPQEVTQHMTAIGVMGISVVLSLVLVAIQSHTLRKAPSLAVEADKAHYAMDIAINLGTTVILVILMHGGPAWLDPAFAVLVAFYLALTVSQIGSKGVDMLLDRELPEDVRAAIQKKVLAHEGVLGMHDLRTTQSGMRIFISFDIEVAADLSLAEAHEIARAVELALFHQFPHAEIMIHVDPHNDTEDTRHQIPGVHH